MTIQLEGANLTKNINNLVKSNDKDHVQSVLVSIIFSTMHGNSDPLNLVAKEGALTGKQRKFILMHAVKPFTTKDKVTGKYSYNHEKAQSTFAALMVDGAVSFEELDYLLPHWSPEKEKTSTKFDAVGSAKRMLARAEKALEAGEFEGEQAVLAQLIKALQPFNV